MKTIKELNKRLRTLDTIQDINIPKELQQEFQRQYQQVPLPNPSDSFKDIIYGEPFMPNTQTTTTNTQTIKTDLSHK